MPESCLANAFAVMLDNLKGRVFRFVTELIAFIISYLLM